MLTSAGIIFFIVMFVAVFSIIFRMQNDCITFHSSVSLFDKIFWSIITALPSILISFVVLILIFGLMLNSTKPVDNYHTIYSNNIKATVSFKAEYQSTEFVGGKQIKDVSDSNSGALTLSKDGVNVKKQIDHVEYLGDVEKGSFVENIEYSNSLIESKIFGVTLIKQKSDRLKIHLKKPASRIAKEKKDAETEKELKNLLGSSR